MKKNIIRAISAVLITLIFAAVAAYFTKTDTEWYLELTKPNIQPDSAFFSIAWAIVCLRQVLLRC